jgi:hypothetical protein
MPPIWAASTSAIKNGSERMMTEVGKLLGAADGKLGVRDYTARLRP